MLTHGCVTVCLKHNDPGSFNLTLHFYYYNTKNYKSFIHFLLPAKQLKWSGKKSISMLKPTWLWAAIKLYKLLWVLPVFVQINQIKNSFILKTYDTQQLTALKILKVLIPVILNALKPWLVPQEVEQKVSGSLGSASGVYFTVFDTERWKVQNPKLPLMNM